VAVKIRLKRLGKIRSPHYRIVVMDARQKRDGRAIEEIGLYHPKNDPSVIQVNSERAQYWLSVGAQPTEAVVALFKRSGDWQKFSGDTSPSGIDPQKPKADRLARYTEAAGAPGEVTEAVTKKSPKKKVEQPEASEPTTDEVKADDAEAPADSAGTETVEAKVEA
jgi:small subunit ribosomal protein S16